MTALDYSKNVKALLGFIVAIPILTGLFSSKSALPFPPVGDEAPIWRFFAVVIAGCATFLPLYLTKERLRGVSLIVLFGLLISSVGIYLGIVEPRYVIPSPRPEGKVVFVIRGSERSPTLSDRFRPLPDDQLIQATGQSDERLTHAYTRESLYRNRLIVFASYESILVFLVLFVGVLAGTPVKTSTP